MTTALTTPSWLEEMRRAHVFEVAAALGCAVADPKHASGGAFGPCPACDRELRHERRGDRRLACGIRREGNGWRCFACDVSGDALHLVAMVLTQRRFGELDDAARADVRTWCASFLRMELEQPERRTVTAAAMVAPIYPPAEEVTSLWRSCSPVSSDPVVARWLAAVRGLDPEAIDRADLARALPPRVAGPDWAWTSEGGHPWSSTMFRCLFPLYDAQGRLRSVLARNARADAHRKSSAVLGFARAGLVLADRAGVAMLRGRVDQDYEGKRVVVIAEGEMNFAAWAIAGEHPTSARTATLGIYSGSWTRDIVARIPRAAEVLIATDRDKAGDIYATSIIETMLERPDLSLTRWVPPT